MLVSDLNDHLSRIQERTITTTLGEISVNDDASVIRIDSPEFRDEFPMDEQAERSLSAYLGVPKAYLAKSPADLKAYNLNYWLQKRAGAVAVIEATNDNLVTVHRPGLVILPLARVAEVITSTMDPSYEIVELIRNDTRFHIDIVTPHAVEVAPDERIEDRQRGEHQVGDITHGGIRILANPTEVEAPQVLTYLHRLVCLNGLISPEKEGTIRLKGNTVDDVIAEMELACRSVLGDLDKKLAEYAALATTYPPGSPARFAYQLCVEAGVTQRVTRRIMERVSILPEDASMYDILQVFTSVANNVPHNIAIRLQELGGMMAFHTEQVVHRCSQCTRLLPDNS